MLDAVDFTFSSDAEALKDAPQLPANTDVQQRPAETPQQAGAGAGAEFEQLPAKRRKFSVLSTPPLDLDAQYKTSSRTAHIRSSDQPVLMQLHCGIKHQVAGTMHMRLHLHFSKDADVALRHQSVTLKLLLNSQQLAQCAPSTPDSQAWTLAEQTELELQAITQVCAASQ